MDVHGRNEVTQCVTINKEKSALAERVWIPNTRLCGMILKSFTRRYLQA